jgi:hypothetical protein
MYRKVRACYVSVDPCMHLKLFSNSAVLFDVLNECQKCMLLIKLCISASFQTRFFSCLSFTGGIKIKYLW